MEWALSGILLLLFSIIIYEDFKYHAITWYIAPVLFVLLAFYGWSRIGFVTLVEYFLINSGIIVLQMLGVGGYFYFKHRSIKGIVNKQLGLGDILVLFAMTVFFSPLNFVLFLLFSLILTLVISSIKFSIFPKSNRQIPLAAYWGIFMNLLILIQLLKSGLSMYETTYIENVILKLMPY